MPFKIKDSLQVGTVVSLTNTGIVTNAAFNIADGTNGFLKKTGINAWSVDTNTYLTSSTGVTSVTGTAPVVSSGGTTPAISMVAATSSVNGYMTSTYASKLDGIATGAQVNVVTDLGQGTITSTTIPLTSSTGTGTTLSAATTSNAGLLSATDKTKLDGIATGATANAGTVTSVGGTGTVSGLSLSGTVTTSGDLTLGGTLSVAASNFASQTAKYALIAPNASAGVPTFRQILWSDLTSTPTTISGYGITDVYTKIEVDNLVTGLDFKQSVRVATTSNITLTGTQTIDEVAVIAGNRVLVKDQSTASQNGLYVVAAGAWSRSTDADNSSAGEVTAGMYCFVEEGTVNANSGWVLTTNDTITLGITSLTFAQFNGLAQVTAGTGLTKSGNTLNHSNSVTGATIAEGGIARTLAYSGVFNVPSITYDNQGHVTSSTSITLTLPTGTNLAQGTRTTTQVPITSSTGSNATLDIATTSLAGVMSSADKTKLDGIATGATANAGTVTSVGLSLPSSELTVSGSPVTVSGSLSATWASQTQKYFFAAPNDGNGTPAFRAILASDIPTLNQTTSGSAGSVANSLTINSSGSGSASPATFNGSTAVTISYNTIGAAPLSHTHGNITNVGAIGSTASLVVMTGTGGVIEAKAAGSTGEYLRGDGVWASPPGATYTAGDGIGLSGGAFSLDTPGTLTISTTNSVSADSHTHAITTASTNTSSTIVARDSSGDFAANIVTVEGVNLDSTVHNKYATATVATVSTTAVDTWPIATYRSCKYLVQINQGTNYQVSEILVIHNGTTTTMTEYAVVETNGSLASFTSDINAGTTTRLLVTMGSATTANIKVEKTLIVV